MMASTDWARVAVMILMILMILVIIVKERACVWATSAIIPTVAAYTIFASQH